MRTTYLGRSTATFTLAYYTPSLLIQPLLLAYAPQENGGVCKIDCTFISSSLSLPSLPGPSPPRFCVGTRLGLSPAYLAISTHQSDKTALPQGCKIGKPSSQYSPYIVAMGDGDGWSTVAPRPRKAAAAPPPQDKPPLIEGYGGWRVRVFGVLVSI